ncbi:carboxypeptidase regulatory-like domain-containing protein [Acidobacteria bacterium AH-259-O06]|nr:carboxypeptidase regulatory-like domain-containing protein [Acidobacteria bacterium AH-259-O06]
MIKGRIETEQGDPVQQATVILFNETFHLRRKTTTDTRGTYTFSQLKNSQNNADFQADLRGPAAFDARNAFSINYTYELPFRGLRRRLPALLIEGWKITGTTEFRTGSWFDITTSSDAPGFGNVDGVKDDRPNITNPSSLGRTEFRTEFRNFFNHPRFKRPGDVFPSPVFGKIIDTQNKGRVMQFMLKVSF